MDTPETPDLTAPVTDATPAVDTPAADPFETGADSFDRAYVERLRGESANYRTKAKPYEEAFGGYTDEDRAVWFEAAKLLATDPKAGGEYLRSVADAVLQQYQEPAAPAAVEGDEKPLTMAEYRSLREAESAQAKSDADVARIESEAKTLGYTDLTSRSYRNLLMVAAELPSGDLKEAHELLEGEKQKLISDYLAAKAAEADGPTPPAGSGFAPSGERQVKSFEDAKRGLDALLDAQMFKR